MADPSTCPHPAWECSWRVEPVPGQIVPSMVQPMLAASQHYHLLVSVRCGACEMKGLFEGQPILQPNSGQMIGTTAGGTILVLRMTMPPAVALAAPQWQPMQTSVSQAAEESPSGESQA